MDRQYSFYDEAEIRTLSEEERQKRKEYQDYYLTRTDFGSAKRHWLKMKLDFMLPETMTEEQKKKVDGIIREAWQRVFYGVMAATDKRYNS